MNPTIEKRKYPRHPVTIQSVFSSGPIRGEEGTVLDLSYEGCRIFSSTVPTPESMIEIQIKPRQGPPVFVPKAVVRGQASRLLELNLKLWQAMKRVN